MAMKDQAASSERLMQTKQDKYRISHQQIRKGLPPIDVTAASDS
jgi:hypothetical protein